MWSFEMCDFIPCIQHSLLWVGTNGDDGGKGSRTPLERGTVGPEPQAVLEWSTIDQLHKPNFNNLEVPSSVNSLVPGGYPDGT